MAQYKVVLAIKMEQKIFYQKSYFCYRVIVYQYKDRLLGAGLVARRAGGRASWCPLTIL